MESAGRTFSILRCLGRGGFGVVYLAEMTSPTGIASLVAVKVLRGDLARGGHALRRLKDEAHALSRLAHPVILRVYDLVVLEGRYALVSEFVDGCDLDRLLQGDAPIGFRAAIEVLARVASALDVAYDGETDGGAPLRLVHRDVKPSNIRIGRHGEVKLLDFGIARTDEGAREAHTATDMLVGSPPYMAPERFRDPVPHPAMDLFSLGCVLLEVLTGQRTFDQSVPLLAGLAMDPARFRAHIAQRLSLADAGCPEPLVALAAELLQYDPSMRPTAREVAGRLEAAAETLEGPSLARYCRDLAWPEAADEPAELVGRVLSEGTFDLSSTGAVESTTPRVPPPAVARPDHRWMGPALIALGVGGGGVLAGGVAVALVATVIGLGIYATIEPPAPVLPPRVGLARPLTPTRAPQAGGNVEACQSYVEHYNALPCLDGKPLDVDDECDPILDDADCDSVDYYRCLSENMTCDGDKMRIDLESCGGSCDKKRVFAIGPNEGACREYIAYRNALQCGEPEDADLRCSRTLDMTPCDWAAHFQCQSEGLTCREGVMVQPPGTVCPLECLPSR